MPGRFGNATFIMWAAMAATVAVICALAVRADEEQQHLTDEQIRRLGPAATARELLDIRREALGHVH
ncbi:hypothetical protein ACFXPR_34455 [Nocardia tengchongensis]|uniref:hypothetical protein n=1 Tax=Nocardia tengchongensis TaxID=2055889 RepID=UPI00368AC00D